MYKWKDRDKTKQLFFFGNVRNVVQINKSKNDNALILNKSDGIL